MSHAHNYDTRRPGDLEPYHTHRMTLTPIILSCPDCDDGVRLEFAADTSRALAHGLQIRCDACEQYAVDEHAAKRRAAVDAVIAMGIRPLVRLGGMNDERYVPCDICSETAATYAGDVSVHALDGKGHICESCHEPGKIVLDDDEGQAYIHFRAYTRSELLAMGDLPL